MKQNFNRKRLSQLAILTVFLPSAFLLYFTMFSEQTSSRGGNSSVVVALEIDSNKMSASSPIAKIGAVASSEEIGSSNQTLLAKSNYTEQLNQANKLKEMEVLSQEYEKDQFKGTETEAKITQLLLADAPLSVLKALVENGMTFPEHAVDVLSNRDLTFIKELESYGLDIFATFDGAYNGLKPSYKKNRQAFDYLLARGVALQPISGALDPLDLTLLKILDIAKEFKGSKMSSARMNKVYKNYPYFVSRLLEYGAPVETSHLTLMRDIRENSFETYQLLVNQSEQLAR